MPGPRDIIGLKGLHRLVRTYQDIRTSDLTSNPESECYKYLDLLLASGMFGTHGSRSKETMTTTAKASKTSQTQEMGLTPPQFPHLPALSNTMGPLQDGCMVCHLELTPSQHILKHVTPNCQRGIHTRCMKSLKTACPSCQHDLTKPVTIESKAKPKKDWLAYTSQMPARKDGYHTTRKRQKQYHSTADFYKIPGYRAQEQYTTAIRAAGKKRGDAIDQSNHMKELLIKKDDRMRDRTVQQARQTYDRTITTARAILDRAIRTADQAMDIRAHLNQKQQEFQAVRTQAQTTYDYAVRAAHDERQDGVKLLTEQNAKERAQIIETWKKELVVAREKLVHAHQTDWESGKLWEEHPPNPLMDKGAVERNESRVYFE